MEDFEEWWKKYPLKVAKGEARKAWAQTAKIRPSMEDLFTAIDRYVAYRNSTDYLQYKHPATWLRSECWDDVYEVAAPAPARPSKTCAKCKEQVFSWVDDKCNPCWKKYMGMAA